MRVRTRRGRCAVRDESPFEPAGRGIDELEIDRRTVRPDHVGAEPGAVRENRSASTEPATVIVRPTRRPVLTFQMSMLFVDKRPGRNPRVFGYPLPAARCRQRERTSGTWRRVEAANATVASSTAHHWAPSRWSFSCSLSVVMPRRPSAHEIRTERRAHALRDAPGPSAAEGHEAPGRDSPARMSCPSCFRTSSVERKHFAAITLDIHVRASSASPRSAGRR